MNPLSFIPFKDQYRKIVLAYRNYEIEPLLAGKCFVGTLLGHNMWEEGRRFKNVYSPVGNREVKYTYHETLYWERGGHVFSIYPAMVNALGEAKVKEKLQLGQYTPREIVMLENEFLKIYVIDGKTEESLHQAICHCLSILKAMHHKRGEERIMISTYPTQRINPRALMNIPKPKSDYGLPNRVQQREENMQGVLLSY